MPDLFRFQVTEEYEEERIDKYMSILIDSLSRSFIQKMMKEEKVLVNGKPAKANYRLKTEDEICFELPEAVEPDIEPENIPLWRWPGLIPWRIAGSWCVPMKRQGSRV